MFYNARWYDPGISQFTSPDTIIPNLYNPLDWNRYSYVRGNPIRYSDPTGHMCREDGKGCDSGKHFPSPIAPPKTIINSASWANDKLLSEGTVYAFTLVMPSSQAEDALLSSKAANSYTGTGNLPEAEMPYWYELTDAITGISSDMHNEFNWNPIIAEINWQHRESGLWIDSVEVTNHSPSYIEISNVSLSTNLGSTVIPGPQIIADSTGIINMNINFQPSRILDTTMTLWLRSEPSFPDHPNIKILIQAGVFPPAGCSFPIR